MSSQATWSLIYDRFKPSEEALREALCTLGNGYFGTRAAALEATASNMHYPATYIAGVYNTLATNIAGRVVYNEDLVNCPNWTFLTFRIGEGEWFCPSSSRILSYRQELDMKRGIVSRRIRFQDKKGRKTLIETKVIVHRQNPHLGLIEYRISPQNYHELLTVRTMIDGATRNTGVERYRQLNTKHLKINTLGRFGNNGVFLSTKTNQSKIEIAVAEKVRVFARDKEIRPRIRPVTFRLMGGRERIGQEFRVVAGEKQSYTIEKIAALYTSKDRGTRDVLATAITAVRQAPRFHLLLETHQKRWEQIWEKIDIRVEGDTFSQLVLRLHLFHLLQVASHNTVNIDTGLPARGLHGEAYRGHIFWDEIFAFHVYDLHFPSISQALLLYRYRRLGRAREAARRAGYRGAMFPWQSGSTGGEETQQLHLNPLSGKWGPDYSYLQRHISFAIAYNVWQHWERTHDIEFFKKFGGELLLSIAQFGSSLTKYDPKDKRYHTKGLMGPDEFHEKLPHASKGGFKDNAYTNAMIAWTLRKAKEILTILPKHSRERIIKKIHLEKKEIARWGDIIQKMNIIISKEGIISQFEGYFSLKELDWAAYRAEYKNIRRMDRILKAEGKSPNTYKVSKQADVLMIFYLFDFSQAQEIFKNLGITLTRDFIRENYEYYIKRTSHGSTLSKVVHCFLAHFLGKRKEAWQFFLDVLESDIYDSQRGTTQEGIHVGVMGGSIDLVTRRFSGFTIQQHGIGFDPQLPKKWQRVTFRLCYQGKWIWCSFSKQKLTLRLISGGREPFFLPVQIKGKQYFLTPEKPLRVWLRKERKKEKR